MKRVLVVRGDHWLSAGIESLLAREKDFELVGVSLDDESDIFDVLEKFKPEVIIVDEIIRHSHLITLLSFLKDNSKMRLILVSVRDKFIYLFHRQEILVSSVGDLFAVIRGESPLCFPAT
jgi:chemotaxis response regulator CheB